MRKFKFRVWDKNNKCFLEDDYINNFFISLDGKSFKAVDYELAEGLNNFFISLDGKSFKAVDYEFSEGYGIIEIEKIEISQYTGLQDNNGMEIFEGDILWNTYDECYGEVTFEEGEWKFEDSTVIQPLYSLLDYVEIRGNIYENNELLE